MIRPVTAIIKRNLLKFSRDRMRLMFTLIMSGLFMFIFSFAMRSTSTGIEHPMNYLIAGVVIMLVFQTSLSNSMHILEDISSGFMKEIIVAPIARWQIALGQILSTMFIAVAQGLIVIIVGFFTGLRLDPLHLILMVGLMFLVAFTFSSMGLLLAAVTKESTNFQILINLLTIPLVFLSGAYIPTTVLPEIMAPVVYCNPLTYTTAAFRYVTLQMEHLPVDALLKAGVAFRVGGYVVMPTTGVLIVAVMGVVLFVACVNMFSRADFSRVKIFKRGHH